MKPAPTSGAARPLTVHTYVQKYAYIKNSGGSLVAASAPVWLPATMTECQTAAGSSSPVCDSGAPQRLTTYQYGANRSEEHTSELQSLMRISYAVFCLKKKKPQEKQHT